MQNSRFQSILLPGEEINLKSLMKESSASNVKLGQSLRICPEKDMVVQSQIGGKLYYQEVKDSFLLFPLNTPQRFIPEMDDLVLGIVKHKQGDNYIIDINTINDCYLNIYNFPGATKRNYPILQPGALVFCKVSSIPKYLPIQLSCLSGTSTKHFSTNQNELGELKNGIVCNSSKITTLNQLDKICLIAHQVIDKIEIVVGKNYRIWLEAKGNQSREALVYMKGVIESEESMNNMLSKMENMKQILLAMK